MRTLILLPFTILGHLIALPFLIVFWLLGLAVLAFEIWMLIDVIQNKKLESTEKILWIIGMLVIHPFVAIAYYFFGRNASLMTPSKPVRAITEAVVVKKKTAKKVVKKKKK